VSQLKFDEHTINRAKRISDYINQFFNQDVFFIVEKDEELYVDKTKKTKKWIPASFSIPYDNAWLDFGPEFMVENNKLTANDYVLIVNLTEDKFKNTDKIKVRSKDNLNYFKSLFIMFSNALNKPLILNFSYYFGEFNEKISIKLKMSIKIGELPTRNVNINGLNLKNVHEDTHWRSIFYDLLPKYVGHIDKEEFLVKPLDEIQEQIRIVNY